MENNYEELAKLLPQYLSKDELANLFSEVSTFKNRDYSKYIDKPLKYIYEVLGGSVWQKQADILQSYVDNQYTIVTSAHSTGKSRVLGSLVNYAFDVYQPGTLISTAPSQTALEDVLWSEVRIQRKHETQFFKPAAPRMERGPDSRASGFTASSGEGFQGRHYGKITLLLDEAAGIDTNIFKAAKSMITKPEDRFVMTLNPMNPSCAAFQFQQQHKQANVIEISMLDHPNIQHELEGRPAPIPFASRLKMLMGYINAHTEIIRDKINFRKYIDIEWPDKDYKILKSKDLNTIDFPGIFDDSPDHVILKPTMYRVSNEFEGRVLGRWPSNSINSIWSQALIKKCSEEVQDVPLAGDRKWGPPVIGLDPAAFGDDYAVFIVRWGPCVLECYAYQVTDGEFLNKKLKELARKWAQRAQCGVKHIKCYYDNGGGYGQAITVGSQAYTFVPINGAEVAGNENIYSNRRAELWFQAAIKAKDDAIEWTRLDKEQRKILSNDLINCRYEYDTKDRYKLISKKILKKELGHSPDYGDALALTMINYWQAPKLKRARNYSFRETENYKGNGFTDFNALGNSASMRPSWTMR